MASHKIFLVFMYKKNGNNNKQNGVQVQVTNERKMTNYYVNTKHIPNTGSKKEIKEVMTLFQHKTRMKRQQQ